MAIQFFMFLCFTSKFAGAIKHRHKALNTHARDIFATTQIKNIINVFDKIISTWSLQTKIYSALSVDGGHFCTNISQKTLHSSPVRVRYGMTVGRGLDFHLSFCYASAFRRRRHYVFGLSVRPSVRPKPEIPSFDLYIGPLVHPTNRYRFTACPSVRRGFRAFTGDCMEGLAWNFTCWCILTIFRTDQFMVMVWWFF